MIKRLYFILIIFLLNFPALASGKEKNQITAALTATLESFKSQKITFSPRAIYFSPNQESLQRCENNKNFNASFKGFSRLIAYYILFRLQLDGVYPYATNENKIFDNKNNQFVTIDSLDQLIKSVDFNTLKDFAFQALKSIDKKDFNYLQSLVEHFQRTYKNFSHILTPEVIAELERQEQQDYFDFSVLGFPLPPDCFAERFYTAEVIGKGIFNQEKTYFSIGSIDDYLYGFWWRRYHHQTINEVKELLDEIAVFLTEHAP